jgi:hypothetical protein
MTQTISRVYANSERATAAVSALVDAGYDSKDIRVVALSDAASSSVEDVTRAIQRAGVRNPTASDLAPSVGSGGVLVVCRAAFTTAAGATAVLEHCGPLATSRPNRPVRQVEWDDDRPLSAIFGWKLLSDTALPFAKFWAVASLTASGPWLSQRAQFPLLARRQGPVFGNVRLSDNPTPCSAMFGIPTLLKKTLLFT